MERKTLLRQHGQWAAHSRIVQIRASSSDVVGGHSGPPTFWISTDCDHMPPLHPAIRKPWFAGKGRPTPSVSRDRAMGTTSEAPKLRSLKSHRCLTLAEAPHSDGIGRRIRVCGSVDRLCRIVSTPIQCSCAVAAITFAFVPSVKSSEGSANPCVLWCAWPTTSPSRSGAPRT